jgi:hypothetical protein
MNPLTDADKFVIEYMLGAISQGHGHRRSRGFMPAVKYLRMQYNYSLETAAALVKALVKAFETVRSVTE